MKRASTSMLQRRFRIGYTRAARIVELMEERGIVGPLNGAKPREILVSKMEMERLLNPGGPLPGITGHLRDQSVGLGPGPFAASVGKREVGLQPGTFSAFFRCPGC